MRYLIPTPGSNKRRTTFARSTSKPDSNHNHLAVKGVSIVFNYSVGLLPAADPRRPANRRDITDNGFIHHTNIIKTWLAANPRIQSSKAPATAHKTTPPNE